MRCVKMLLMVLICGMLLSTQTGCLVAAAAGAAAGTVAYVKGDLETTFDHKPDVVMQAVRDASTEMGLTTEYANASSIDGQAKLRSGADKEIFIKIRALGERSSRMSIRVGTFGDESFSQMLLGKIQSHLPATAPPPAAPTAAATAGE